MQDQIKICKYPGIPFGSARDLYAEAQAGLFSAVVRALKNERPVVPVIPLYQFTKGNAVRLFAFAPEPEIVKAGAVKSMKLQSGPRVLKRAVPGGLKIFVNLIGGFCPQAIRLFYLAGLVDRIPKCFIQGTFIDYFVGSGAWFS
ncbi:MAG: hypothetical protein GWM98_20810 [Nitrospinaceae bacterium]|nr:hypothetical protein [Nitrospinaceae bacterium]NIR56465.1 hypothetical protein [Nitrospinaceae bacterium]NIS86926.1 hypothetical protein [Nitrospinaceae bacterium]NIT83764.1 hypothetical protein [Nitrospinaceae bacterium]NIU45967.1 hypothetical protein [Nitrospinaceae bacterium]